jgi:hypothetical protein
MQAVRESAERQRLADAALRASEERYRELFDNANDLATRTTSPATSSP